MTIVHFRNLTNGLLCGCPPYSVALTRVLRIQSTACEQHRYEDILKEVGADFYYCLATGKRILIHDKSERDRETRACWQGLSWLRYACHRAWRKGEPPAEFGRGQMLLNPYWEKQWRKLPRSARNLVKYYRRFDVGGMLDVYSCYTPKTVRTHVKPTQENLLNRIERIREEVAASHEGGHLRDDPKATLPAWSSRPKFIALPAPEGEEEGSGLCQLDGRALAGDGSDSERYCG